MGIYTKERLLQEFINTVRRNTIAMENLNGSFQRLNDQNVLHNQKDDKNYETIERLVSNNNKIYKFFMVIFSVVIAAIIILAGAEKALKIIPLFQ